MAGTTFLARAYQADTFVYHVDVVGTCNLGCASCPVGNMPSASVERGSVPKGFMPYERFRQILEKIVREAPVARPVIALYNWGEPLLHPDIGRIIRLVRHHNLYCAVSTNLNQIRFLEDVVEASPSSIKISLSGFSQAIYGRTHNNGDVERVKSNLRRLREAVDAHGRPIDIFIGYHDYVGNGGEELAAIESLAHELRFQVRHKIARLSPLEKVLALCHDKAAPESGDQALYDLLLVKPSEWSAIATRDGRDDTCVMRDQEMAINFDGSVALCCNVFDYANNVARDFLGESHDAIQAGKRQHPLCGPCMAAGYPKSCGLDAHPDVQAIVATRAAAVHDLVTG